MNEKKKKQKEKVNIPGTALELNLPSKVTPGTVEMVQINSDGSYTKVKKLSKPATSNKNFKKKVSVQSDSLASVKEESETTSSSREYEMVKAKKAKKLSSKAGVEALSNKESNTVVDIKEVQQPTLTNSVKKMNIKTLEDEFKEFDKDSDGLLSLEDCHIIIANLNLNAENEQIDNLIKEKFPSKENFNFQEFSELMMVVKKIYQKDADTVKYSSLTSDKIDNSSKIKKLQLSAINDSIEYSINKFKIDAVGGDVKSSKTDELNTSGKSIKNKSDNTEPSLKNMFQKYDKSNTGNISLKHAKFIMKNMGIKEFPSKYKRLENSAGSKEVTYKDLENIVREKKPLEEGNMNFSKKFAEYDIDNKGVLNKGQLNMLLSGLRSSMNLNFMKDELRKFKFRNENEVTLEEFIDFGKHLMLCNTDASLKESGSLNNEPDLDRVLKSDTLIQAESSNDSSLDNTVASVNLKSSGKNITSDFLDDSKNLDEEYKGSKIGVEKDQKKNSNSIEISKITKNLGNTRISIPKKKKKKSDVLDMSSQQEEFQKLDFSALFLKLDAENKGFVEKQKISQHLMGSDLFMSNETLKEALENLSTKDADKFTAEEFVNLGLSLSKLHTGAHRQSTSKSQEIDTSNLKSFEKLSGNQLSSCPKNSTKSEYSCLKRINECKKIFDTFDIEKSGKISAKDLKNLLKSVGVEEIDAYLGGKKRLGEKEAIFFADIKELILENSKIMKESLDFSELFSEVDRDGNGIIDRKEFIETLKVLDVSESDDLVKAGLFQSGLRDKSLISLNEFVNFGKVLQSIIKETDLTTLVNEAPVINNFNKPCSSAKSFSSKKQLTETMKNSALKKIKKIKIKLEHLDKNQSGKVMVNDLEKVLLSAGVEKSEHQLQSLKNNLGKGMEFKEFAEMLIATENIEDFSGLFKEADVHNTSQISKTNLRETLLKLGPLCKEEHVQKALELSTFGDEKQIPLEEFLNFGNKLNEIKQSFRIENVTEEVKNMNHSISNHFSKAKKSTACESQKKLKSAKFSADKYEDYKNDFEKFAKSNGDIVLKDNIEKFLEAMKIKKSEKELKELKGAVDKNGVNFDELFHLLNTNSKVSNGYKNIQNIFSKYDNQGKGYITGKNCTDALLDLGYIPYSNDSLDVIKKLNLKDDKINAKDFKKICEEEIFLKLANKKKEESVHLQKTNEKEMVGEILGFTTPVNKNSSENLEKFNSKNAFRLLTNEETELYKTAFENLDKKNTGKLNTEKLQELISITENEKTIKDISALLESKNIKEATLDEFLSMLSLISLPKFDEKGIKAVFSKLDSENKGYLAKKEIFEGLKLLGCDEENVIKDAMKRLGLRKKSNFSFGDFMKITSKLSELLNSEKKGDELVTSNNETSEKDTDREDLALKSASGAKVVNGEAELLSTTELLSPEELNYYKKLGKIKGKQLEELLRKMGGGSLLDNLPLEHLVEKKEMEIQDIILEVSQIKKFRELEEKAKYIFLKVDREKKGTLSKKDLKKCLTEMGFEIENNVEDAIKKANILPENQYSFEDLIKINSILLSETKEDFGGIIEKHMETIITNKIPTSSAFAELVTYKKPETANHQFNNVSKKRFADKQEICKDLFKKLDEKKTGKLRKEKIIELFNNLGCPKSPEEIQNYLSNAGIKNATIKDCLLMINDDGTIPTDKGTIIKHSANSKELEKKNLAAVALCSNTETIVSNPSDQKTVENFISAFENVKKTNESSLTKAELKKLLKSIGVEIPNESISSFFKAVGKKEADLKELKTLVSLCHTETVIDPTIREIISKVDTNDKIFFSKNDAVKCIRSIKSDDLGCIEEAVIQVNQGNKNIFTKIELANILQSLLPSNTELKNSCGSHHDVNNATEAFASRKDFLKEKLDLLKVEFRKLENNNTKKIKIEEIEKILKAIGMDESIDVVKMEFQEKKVSEGTFDDVSSILKGFSLNSAIGESRKVTHKIFHSRATSNKPKSEEFSSNKVASKSTKHEKIEDNNEVSLNFSSINYYFQKSLDSITEKLTDMFTAVEEKSSNSMRRIDLVRSLSGDLSLKTNTPIGSEMSIRKCNTISEKAISPMTPNRKQKKRSASSSIILDAGNSGKFNEKENNFSNSTEPNNTQELIIVKNSATRTEDINDPSSIKLNEKATLNNSAEEFDLGTFTNVDNSTVMRNPTSSRNGTSSKKRSKSALLPKSAGNCSTLDNNNPMNINFCEKIALVDISAETDLRNLNKTDKCTARQTPSGRNRTSSKKRSKSTLSANITGNCSNICKVPMEEKKKIPTESILNNSLSMKLGVSSDSVKNIEEFAAFDEKISTKCYKEKFSPPETRISTGLTTSDQLNDILRKSINSACLQEIKTKQHNYELVPVSRLPQKFESGKEGESLNNLHNLEKPLNEMTNIECENISKELTTLPFRNNSVKSSEKVTASIELSQATVNKSLETQSVAVPSTNEYQTHGPTLLNTDQKLMDKKVNEGTGFNKCVSAIDNELIKESECIYNENYVHLTKKLPNSIERSEELSKYPIDGNFFFDTHPEHKRMPCTSTRIPNANANSPNTPAKEHMLANEIKNTSGYDEIKILDNVEIFEEMAALNLLNEKNSASSILQKNCKNLAASDNINIPDPEVDPNGAKDLIYKAFRVMKKTLEVIETFSHARGISLTFLFLKLLSEKVFTATAAIDSLFDTENVENDKPKNSTISSLESLCKAVRFADPESNVRIFSVDSDTSDSQQLSDSSKMCNTDQSDTMSSTQTDNAYNDDSELSAFGEREEFRFNQTEKKNFFLKKPPSVNLISHHEFNSNLHYRSDYDKADKAITYMDKKSFRNDTRQKFGLPNTLSESDSENYALSRNYNYSGHQRAKSDSDAFFYPPNTQNYKKFQTVLKHKRYGVKKKANREKANNASFGNKSMDSSDIETIFYDKKLNIFFKGEEKQDSYKNEEFQLIRYKGEQLVFDKQLGIYFYPEGHLCEVFSGTADFDDDESCSGEVYKEDGENSFNNFSTRPKFKKLKNGVNATNKENYKDFLESNPQSKLPLYSNVKFIDGQVSINGKVVHDPSVSYSKYLKQHYFKNVDFDTKPPYFSSSETTDDTIGNSILLNECNTDSGNRNENFIENEDTVENVGIASTPNIEGNLTLENQNYSVKESQIMEKESDEKITANTSPCNSSNCSLGSEHLKTVSSWNVEEKNCSKSDLQAKEVLKESFNSRSTSTNLEKTEEIRKNVNLGDKVFDTADFIENVVDSTIKIVKPHGIVNHNNNMVLISDLFANPISKSSLNLVPEENKILINCHPSKNDRENKKENDVKTTKLKSNEAVSDAINTPVSKNSYSFLAFRQKSRSKSDDKDFHTSKFSLKKLDIQPEWNSSVLTKKEKHVIPVLRNECVDEDGKIFSASIKNSNSEEFPTRANSKIKRHVKKIRNNYFEQHFIQNENINLKKNLNCNMNVVDYLARDKKALYKKLIPSFKCKYGVIDKGRRNMYDSELSLMDIENKTGQHQLKQKLITNIFDKKIKTSLPEHILAIPPIKTKTKLNKEIQFNTKNEEKKYQKSLIEKFNTTFNNKEEIFRKSKFKIPLNDSLLLTNKMPCLKNQTTLKSQNDLVYVPINQNGTCNSYNQISAKSSRISKQYFIEQRELIPANNNSGTSAAVMKEYLVYDNIPNNVPDRGKGSVYR
ncbi:hypothetical protein HK099_005270 [Clydaea vesicula]|uniref:EF-hand domain-containing protein n=1 Tax=Clydaea vesicula TaxID=447962 RepID=A0AAD5U8V2_9FUNG|nr:hypothetical protein HK099_005270 [Clydaea vesicula]